MTTNEATRKLYDDINQLRSMVVIGNRTAIAMAEALMVDSVNALISAAKAEGAREELDRMTKLADEAKTLSTT